MGGPQQVVYLINALRERGHDNTLVCPPDSGIDAVARRTGIRVWNLPCAGDLDLRFVYRLHRLINELAPDIVHCHSRRGADILGGLAAARADVPAVVSRRVDNTEWQPLATLRYRPFRKIIAISNAVADALRKQGVVDERVAVIRSAVDADRLAQQPDRDAFKVQFGIDDGVFTIAAVGQLIPRKGHRYLLQAVADLAHSHPSVRLLIFGDGYLNNQLRAQAAAAGLGGIVQFVGFRDDLDDYIACFDLLVHPALTEGLGVIALKAAAAGVPVVGFDAGGLNEAVDHERSGLLVPPRDVEQLRHAIVTLIEDAPARQRMGVAGRERMQQEFSIAAMADKHVVLYDSITNG